MPIRRTSILGTTQKDYTRYPFMNLSLEDMDGEQWIEMAQFDGYFLVSNYGRIWALPRPVNSSTGLFYYTKERIRKQSLNKVYNEYTRDYTEQLGVHIRYNGNSHGFLINRLVYDLFVGPINFEKDGLLVVHKDGDNCNNRADNLVLMNGTELYAHGLQLQRRPRSGRKIMKGENLVWCDANSPRSIVQYTLDGKKIKEYESVGSAAKATGYHRASIRHVAQKKMKQLYGFVYRYNGDVYKGENADFSWEEPVRQYSLDGKKVGEYPSVVEAARRTGIDANTISRCALRKIRMGSGYVWRYRGDQYVGEYADKIKNRSKALIQYSLSGKKIARFPSINQAAVATGFSAATLVDCASRRSKVSHGYVWRFEGDTYKGEYKNHRIGRPVTQYSLEGKLIATHPTIEAAAKVIGLTPDSIQKNVIGENKTAGGYVWKYATDKEINRLPAYKQADYVRNPKVKPVIQYAVEGKRLAEYPSIAEVSKAFKVSLSCISQALDKPGRTCAGFVWRTKGHRYYGELARKPAANKPRLVTQYDLQGRKIKVFKSTRHAGKETGISSSTISAVATGRLKTTGGFIWQYGEGPRRIDLDAYFASTRKHIENSSKPVIKCTLDGRPVAEYPSIAAAARAEEIAVSRISSAVNGKSHSAVGYRWKRKE